MINRTHRESLGNILVVRGLELRLANIGVDQLLIRADALNEDKAVQTSLNRAGDRLCISPNLPHGDRRLIEGLLQPSSPLQGKVRRIRVKDEDLLTAIVVFVAS